MGKPVRVMKVEKNFKGTKNAAVTFRTTDGGLEWALPLHDKITRAEQMRHVVSKLANLRYLGVSVVYELDEE